MAHLLESATIVEPREGLLEAASHLRELGLIEFRIIEFVRCVDERDGDFRFRRGACAGRIDLIAWRDEDGDEYRCPECDRVVRPRATRKRQYRRLRVRVLVPGVLSWLHRQLLAHQTDVVTLDDATLQIRGLGDIGVMVHVLDAGSTPSERINRRSFAAHVPVCYITIGPRVAAPRLLDEPWLCHVRLTDLLAGTANVQEMVRQAAAREFPSGLGNIDYPVLARGVIPIQPAVRTAPTRQFALELRDDRMLIDGEVVVHPQAGPRLALVRVFMKQHLEDLIAGCKDHEFTALSIKRLSAELEKVGHRYRDDLSLRRVVNNLQTDIETIVKRTLGKPIGREDIVETCRMANQTDTSGGYRLNPRTVLVRASTA